LSYEDYIAVFVFLGVLVLCFFLIRRRKGKYWEIEHFDNKPQEYEKPPEPSLKQNNKLVFEGSNVRSYEDFVELLTEEELRRIEERGRPPQD